MIAKEDAVEVLSLLTNWRTKFMRMGDLSGNELLTLRAVINRKEAGAPDYTMAIWPITSTSPNRPPASSWAGWKKKGFSCGTCRERTGGSSG